MAQFGADAIYAALAAKGRRGDTQLAHITADEAALLKALGGAGTRNPKTGLREFYGNTGIGGGRQGAGGNRGADKGGYGGGSKSGGGGKSSNSNAGYSGPKGISNKGLNDAARSAAANKAGYSAGTHDRGVHGISEAERAAAADRLAEQAWGFAETVANVATGGMFDAAKKTAGFIGDVATALGIDSQSLGSAPSKGNKNAGLTGSQGMEGGGKNSDPAQPTKKAETPKEQMKEQEEPETPQSFIDKFLEQFQFPFFDQLQPYSIDTAAHDALKHDALYQSIQSRTAGQG